jgi:toxin-antitoxin system PIN domain toxin
VTVALDANILIYASDVKSPSHQAARRFLEECLDGPELFCVTWPTLAAYLRVTTHASASHAPLSTDEAAANVAALLAHPRSRVLREEDGFWRVFRELLISHRARGKLVHDVHLAALLRQHGVKTLYTRDRDFRRFEFLDVRDPFAS